ncbi:MAG TPA: hypothetical protein VEV86_01690, partial [Vicinamibacterales bacterium]|nr:hypothetical protein [Vicinamibacterales bacterium]
MAAVACIPALSLLIGASLGLNIPLDARACAWSMLPAWVCAFVLWRRRASVAASSAIAFGFLMGGVALTVDARELALHSSIRRLLNEQC